jgi:hypothetical protein
MKSPHRREGVGILTRREIGVLRVFEYRKAAEGRGGEVEWRGDHTGGGVGGVGE